MNVRNWNFFSSKEVRRKVKEHILDTVCLWGAIGLLWYAFVSMVGEHFPDFLQKTVLISKSDSISTSLVTETNFEIIGIDWWVIGIFLFVLWLGYDWPRLYLKKLGTICRFAGFVIPVVYVVRDFEKILNGFYHLFAVYLPYINSYYDTRFISPPAGLEENSIAAFTALCMLLWYMVWLLAYGWNNRVLLATFPVFALGLELAVGLSPQGNGILICFFGAVLLSIIGGTSVIKKIIVLSCVGMSVFFSIFFFESDIQGLTTKKTKQELLRWQNNLTLDDFNPFKLLQIDLHFNWEPLNNNSPQYTGKVVLEIESSNYPVSTIYLRGFYGTIYENGNWTYDASAFEEACKEAGKSKEEVAEKIFQMPYERMQQFSQVAAYDGDTSNTFRILYTGTTGNVAYVPYFSDYSSLDEDYSLRGDYLLEKSIWDSTIQVQGLCGASDYYYWSSVNTSINIGINGWNQEDFLSSYSGLYFGPIDLKGQLSELSWINGLADAYLQVPEDAEYLSKVAEKVEKYVPIYYYKEEGSSQYNDENARRIGCAMAVETYLTEQMSYSLKLDNIPLGSDPIEYALTRSYEGYCMHFASAGTLLLREFGVPARYVSGYAVEPSAFAYDIDKGTYKAEIGDYMAHTWVEIYLDNIGWVPVEVTPGSSLDSLPTDEEIQHWESLSDSHRQDIVDQESESESEESEQPLDDTEDETEKETEEETQSEETEKDTEEGAESDDTDEKNKGGSNDKKVPDSLLQGVKIAGILGLLVIIGVLIWIGTKRWISHYEEVLTRELEKNMTRKVIKRINRRLYTMLRLSNWPSGVTRKWTDTEYRNVLVESFSGVSEAEWDRYMDIIKKNHYSHETISVEEMKYVYECYKKVDWFNKILTRQWNNKH